MQNITNQLTQKSRTLFIYIAVAAMVMMSAQAIFLPGQANAAQITSRKLTLSNSNGAATSVTYTFNFTLPSATVLQSVEILICTTASGTCSTPAGWTGASADLASQPTNLGDASGWADASTTTALRLAKSGNAAAPTGSQTVAFNGVTNPTADNTAFYGRITTYTGTDYSTGPTDSGVVAASTAETITVNLTVDESLTFCTGISGVTTSSCAGATGSAVTLQTAGSTNVSPSATAYGTSQIGVGSNAQNGFAITVNGSTLTWGGNTITAMTGAANTSTVGSEEFGLNLKDNATPNVGAEPDGAGNAAPAGNYATADQYSFVTGETIASDSGLDDFRRFTVSYIANVSTGTEAGPYQSILTYICTATF